jgi:hypothetical protein
MPSRKTKKGEYKDIAHPINSEFRKIIQEKILQEYSKLDQSDDEGSEERKEDFEASGELATQDTEKVVEKEVQE